MFAEVRDDSVVRVFRAARPIEVEGVRYPASIFRDFTRAALASLGYHPIQKQPEQNRAFHFANSPTYALVDGDVVETITFTPWPLDRVRDKRKADVKAEFSGRMAQGFVYDDTIPVDIDANSQRDIDTEFTAATDLTNFPTWPEDYQWRGYDNAFYGLDRAGVVAMAKAARDHKRAMYAAKWTHESAIDALNSIADLAAYDVTTGWPETAAEWLADQE
ncbi:DUF4376 domain-containing protein [Pacificispira sp.]|uniref:DUF4376 domain-containing protein n=1 Tax=Pacificispira sp. TaxID=2888761 RepID=UPI003BAA5AE4